MGRSRETDEWGVGEKVSVDVGSLEKLARQIKDDMDMFHNWVEVWQRTGTESHPSNAQFTELAGANKNTGEIPGGMEFKEAVYVEALNHAHFYAEMRRSVMLIQMGLGALHGGAEFLSSMYPGVDGYNNVRLGTVKDAFPPLPKPDPATAGPGAMPGANMVKAADGKGWDTDNDGVTNIPFAASGGPPLAIDEDESVNSRPDPVAGSTHSGYQNATDTKVPDEKKGGLDGATYRDLQHTIDEGEANMPIVRAGEDVFDYFVDVAETVEDVTDGEDNPNTPGRW